MPRTQPVDQCVCYLPRDGKGVFQTHAVFAFRRSEFVDKSLCDLGAGESEHFRNGHPGCNEGSLG